MRLDLDPWAIFGCNIAKWTILCIVVHFQPVIKLLQKGVRVHQKRVILMQKMQHFSGEGGGGVPSPHPTSLGRLDLNPPILKFCLRYSFPVLNTFAKFRPALVRRRWIQVGSINFAIFLSNRPPSGRNQGCHKFFLPVKNYPTLKFMLLAATATTDVYHVLPTPLSPTLPSRKIYCCYFICNFIHQMAAI